MGQDLASSSSNDQHKELAARCEFLQAAAAIAWGNVVEAYKAAIVPGSDLDPDVALVNYRNARALQLAAEQELLNYLQQTGAR